MSNFQAGKSGVSAALEESVEESSPAGSAPLAVCCSSEHPKMLNVRQRIDANLMVVSLQ